MTLLALLVSGCLSATFKPARGEDLYFKLPIAELEAGNASAWRNPPFQSRVVLDGKGEAYVGLDSFRRVNADARGTAPNEARLVIRAPRAEFITGKLFVPEEPTHAEKIVPFKFAADRAQPEARESFFTVKLAYYQELLNRRLPGAAWFRHEARVAASELGDQPAAEPARNFGRGWNPDNASDAFAFFSGGRAVSENLQLDRALRPADTKRPTAKMVDVAGIQGITVAEIDWSKLIEGKQPRLDPLSKLIPADQHAVFFRTFNDLLRVLDEGLEDSIPVLNAAETRSEDARTTDRYQRQLGLSLSGVGRLVGPQVVKSVAITGSDPFLRTGTDVAVLFEAVDPAALEALLLAQVAQKAAGEASVQKLEGEIAQLAYHGFRSPDRAVCSYIARLGGSVVVTNSPAQLKQLAGTVAGQTEPIAKLPEYIFFRDRYAQGDADENAFLFLSDATIRRWCGPRWRIANLRRTLDAAVLSEVQAQHVDGIADGKVTPRAVNNDLRLAWDSDFQLTPGGAQSSVLNTLAFQTPIIELPLEKVTADEAKAYELWRDAYQQNWRWAFDPIGLRIALDKRRVSADLTVMPLIAGSDYREVVSLTAGGRIGDTAADVSRALGSIVLAIDNQSPLIKQGNNVARQLMAGQPVEPFAWLGQSVSVYMDDDPLWAELSRTAGKDRETFISQNVMRLPIGLECEVSDSLKLTAFLAGLRAFLETSAPGMLRWETVDYKGRSYVKITPTQQAANIVGQVRDPAICYAPTASMLIVTPNEALLKRALDRQIAASEKGTAQSAKPQDKPGARVDNALGRNVQVRVDAKLVQVLSDLQPQAYQSAMQQLAWANLPILNQWHQHYPSANPVDLHERLWSVRLVCPGGGDYVWNDKFQTMESTVYGHPGQPKAGPATPPQLAAFTSGEFGLTFENQGLRARVMLERKKK